MKSFLVGLSAVLASIAIVVGLAWGGWAMYNWMAPKYEATRTKVHKESQFRIDGMTTEIRRHLIEMESAETPTQRRLLCRNVLDLADQAGRDRLPPEIQAEVSKLGNCTE